MRLLRFGVLAIVVCVGGARAEDKTIKSPEGFTNIFDGKSLDGWKPTGMAEVWTVENGLIVCKGGGGGWLLTEKEYGDFEFQCEYRWEKKGGNSGVALRTADKGDPAYVGMEIQLIDDEGWPGKLADYQHTGSIYNVQPAKEAKNKPIGEWNTVKIVCNGRKVTVVHNDVELVNADLDDYKVKFNKHPGLNRETGRVGFQSYNVRVEFRNVWIRDLKQADDGKVVKFVEKLGGTITRDEKRPGKPVIKVFFESGKVADADLKQIATLKELTSLGLADCDKVTDVGLKELAVLAKLRTLDIGGCKKVTDAGLKELAALNNLALLNLDSTGVTDAGLKELASLNNLKWIFLGSKKLTDAGLKELSTFKNLTLIELMDCPEVTDVGLKELATLKNLTDLTLYKINATDTGLKELAALKNLEKLNLENCKSVTDAGVKELQKALPKCKITRK